MCKNHINYTLTPNARGTGYFAHVVHNASVDAEAALTGTSNISGIHIDQATIKLIIDNVSTYLARQLAHGNCVTIGDVRVGLAIEGKFDAANAPFDPDKHRIKVVAAPRKALQTTVEELAPVNATDTSHPIFENVWCTATPDRSLRGGEVCEANGNEFRDPNGAKIDRIWLESEDGKPVATGDVRMCDATRLSFTFPPGIAPGEYILVAERPNRDGRTRARARRKVRVGG